MVEQGMAQAPTGGGASSGRGIFLWVLTVCAGALGMGVYQVPQPWRGWLIGWLLFVVTVGVLVLRFLRHYYQYKTAQLLRQGMNAPRPATRPAPPAPRVEDLKVVLLESNKGGRYVLR